MLKIEDIPRIFDMRYGEMLILQSEVKHFIDERDREIAKRDARIAELEAQVTQLEADKSVWVRRADKTWHEGKFLEKIADLERRLALAVEALEDARDDVSDWAGYASKYFQQKLDLAGDIARINDSIAQLKEKKE